MRLLIRLIVATAAICLFAVLPARAEWYEARSQHFLIYADEPPDVLRRYADRLERFDQAVRFHRHMNDAVLTDSERVHIYVLKDIRAVANLAGSKMAAGFYLTRASGSFAFVPRTSHGTGKNDLSPEAIFFHEYAHHLQLQESSIAMPEWVREGFAEFFATAKIEKDGSVKIGDAPQYRGWALFNASGLTLEQMVGATYRNLSDDAEELLYGEAWLLTHYLAFNDARKGQFVQYVIGIQKGMSALDSARAAFGDLKELNIELERYKKKEELPAVRVPAKALNIQPSTLRKLRPGEAAMMDVHIRSTRGVDSKTAADVAKDARKVAADYPDDPFVQSSLAEAEYDVKDYAAADAAADAAIAGDPKNVHALLYKGLVEMALAKAHTAGASWSDARHWFIKANTLDTENAEPLEQFFLSFVEAGQQPTKNAVDALLYAVVLAPRDAELRIIAVRQMLTDNRLQEAKTLLTPLAYQPHASAEWRDTFAKALDFVEAGNGGAALALINQWMKRAEETKKS